MKKISPWRGKSAGKTTLMLLMAAFALASLAVTLVQYARGNTMLASRGLTFPLLLLLPLVLDRLGFAGCWRFYGVLYVFLLFAYCYGSVWGGFRPDKVVDYVPAWLPLWLQSAFRANMVMDKVSHFLSGFLFTILGLCFYYLLAGPSEKDGRAPAGAGKNIALPATWALFFSTFVAVMWEVFEFFDFIFTGNDSQNGLTTGVMDTMGDLMACLLASLLSAVSFVLWRKKGLKLLTGFVMEEFLQKSPAGLPGLVMRPGGDEADPQARPAPARQPDNSPPREEQP